MTFSIFRGTFSLDISCGKHYYGPIKCAKHCEPGRHFDCSPNGDLTICKKGKWHFFAISYIWCIYRLLMRSPASIKCVAKRRLLIIHHHFHLWLFVARSPNVEYWTANHLKVPWQLLDISLNAEDGTAKYLKVRWQLLDISPNVEYNEWKFSHALRFEQWEYNRSSVL